MLNNIFDTHAHYTDKRFADDQAQVLRSLPGRGVARVLTCGTSFADSRAALALAREYDYIYAACGVHPHEASGFDGPDELRVLLRDEKCVALGEIGLDYHYDFSPRDVQKECFEKQLALARELNLPVIIHDREAHKDTLNILRKVFPLTPNPSPLTPIGVVHCFSGCWEFAREVLALGLYIGLGGAVTFKNAHRPAEVAAQIPLNRLLLETDAPYMAPEPHRGQRCDSSHIAYTAEKIAAVRGMDAQELIDACHENGKRLFALEEYLK